MMTEILAHIGGKEEVRDTLRKADSETIAKIEDGSRETRLETLRNYDLSFLTQKFANSEIELGKIPEQVYLTKTLLGGKIDTDIPEKLEADFKKWISLLILYPEERIAPPRVLDMYWHLFMLHTKEYHEFCSDVLGFQLGHSPVTKDTVEETKVIGQNTRRRYISLYGQMDYRIWGGNAISVLRGSNAEYGMLTGCRGDGVSSKSVLRRASTDNCVTDVCSSHHEPGCGSEPDCAGR